MQSIITALYFLPSIISLIWTISFAFKKRSTRQSVFMTSQALAVFYFICYALYIYPNVDYPLMVRMDAFNVPVTLTMIALAVIYMHMYYTKSTSLRPWYMMLLAPAFIIGSVCGTIYYILGFDKAAEVTRIYDSTGVFPLVDEQTMKLYKTYNLFAEVIFNDVSGLLGLALVTICVMLSRKEGYRFGDITRFLFRHNESTPGRILSVLFIIHFCLFLPMIVLGRTYMMHHTSIALATTSLFAIVLHCICHIETFSYVCPTMTLHSLVNVNLSPTQNEPVEDTEQENHIEEEKTPDSAFMKFTYERFIHLMEEEEMFRHDDLTLATLSKEMNVGRTTLSQMIKIHYGVPFRDVINKYRIEAAMRYMRSHPDATQEVIAMKCGYKNGNYLNSKFKELVGETPLMWLAKLQAKSETGVR